MKITFNALLDEDNKKFAENIIKEINLENDNIINSKTNYNLKNLLINCGKEEIEGMVYNFTYKFKKNKPGQKNKQKENIIDIIYDKISNILPQDIICKLPDNNVIKKKYNEEKKYFSFESYIKDKKYNNYKISIIYTFNNISNIINGANNEMKFMVSEIRSENQLKNEINDLKNNKFEKTDYILIHFDQLNSNKIQFIISFINKNFKDDNYYYIFIIHIKRHFDQKDEKIYSILDINPDINQLFIDNLNGKEIKLGDLLKKKIKDILDENDKLMDLNNEFKKVLSKFVYKELFEKGKGNNLNNKNYSITRDNYENKILNLMYEEDKEDENNNFKMKIIKKTKDLIDKDKQDEGDCKNIIDKIFKENYVSKNTLDIISCIFEYIKEKVYYKYLNHILEALEDNNFLTTFLEIKSNKDNELDKDVIIYLEDKFLNSITMDKKDYDPKFLIDYKIPGSYNFYKNLSNYINQNITLDYFNNEKKIRELFKGNIEQEKNNFHDKEEMLLNILYEGISKEFSFEFEIINKIPPYLILKDYINYYLDKYNSKDDMKCKLIELLLELRFNSENKKVIIMNNQNDDFKIVLIKIMWIESNVNYILKILNIYEYAKHIFNEENILYNMIEKKNNNITYITNENRNQEHRIEVNECYYIILASLCYTVTSDEIRLINDINLENDEKEINVNIDKYCSLLKEINNILQSLNNDLYIYLNEMYIIDELIIIIIELIKLKDIDLNKIEYIRKLLRENALIIQKNQPDKITELISNFLNINDSLISKEINNEEDKNYCNKYYDTYIFKRNQ